MRPVSPYEDFFNDDEFWDRLWEDDEDCDGRTQVTKDVTHSYSLCVGTMRVATEEAHKPGWVVLTHGPGAVFTTESSARQAQSVLHTLGLPATIRVNTTSIISEEWDLEDPPL